MNIFNYFEQYIRLVTIWDIVDILIVATLLYQIIKYLRNTVASKLLKGLFIVIVMMQLSDIMNLHVVNYLITGAMQLGTFALVIVFQPELRRLLEKFGGASLLIFKGNRSDDETTIMIKETVEAVDSMSWSKTGALIVFERVNSLSHISSTGTTINSDVSAELLKNIFYPKAPLHDGAIVISNYQISAAGCILPLSSRFDLSKDLGTRHRAALGISETCDCCCVVVSEETGAISLAKNGELFRHMSPQELEKRLEKELMPEDPAKTLFTRIKGVFTK